MIRVFLCDDQIVVTEGLRKILSTDPEIEILGAAHDGEELLNLVHEDPPDLVLIDLKMPVMNGILTTRKLRQDFPDVHVLVLTTYDDDEWIFDALRAGADGYLLKDLPPAQLIAAIKGTAKGKSYIDPKITNKVMDKAASVPQMPENFGHFDLSEREMEVLKLIVQGFSNADIAERLFLSEGTVRNYTGGVFSKLGVTTRTQAAVTAIKFGLVDLSDL
jgi:DNA-binding NarL/FixJ family response regulator